MLPTNFVKVDIEAHVKSGRPRGCGKPQRKREAKGRGQVATTMPNGIVSFVVVAAVAVLCFVALTKLTLTCALLLLLPLPLQVATCGMAFGTSLCHFFYFCLRVALVLCVGKPNEIFTHFPFYILTCSCRSMLTQPPYPSPPPFWGEAAVLSCRVEALRPHMNLTFCVCFFAAKHI